MTTPEPYQPTPDETRDMSDTYRELLDHIRNYMGYQSTDIQPRTPDEQWCSMISLENHQMELVLTILPTPVPEPPVQPLSDPTTDPAPDPAPGPMTASDPGTEVVAVDDLKPTT